MPTSKPRIEVIPTRRFGRDLKALNKVYRHVRDDVQPLIEQLQKGEAPGDHIPGIGFPAYKVRLNSRDLKRGKQGGFRVVYYIETATARVLLSIYVHQQGNEPTLDELRAAILVAIEERRQT